LDKPMIQTTTDNTITTTIRIKVRGVFEGIWMVLLDVHQQTQILIHQRRIIKEILVKSPSFALESSNIMFVWPICDIGYEVFGYEFMNCLFHLHSESLSGHDALADSTAEADPGISAPKDSIS
nr:hypothetical protein [Tanacetum cinerariifolium]